MKMTPYLYIKKWKFVIRRLIISIEQDVTEHEYS